MTSYCVMSALEASNSDAGASLAKGARLFRTRCGLCHTMAPGCNKSGPSLWGIFGKEAGTVDGYVYTQAMRQSGVVWTEESMFGFLRSPKQYIPGNKMIFQGLARDQDAKDVIAYIKAESDGVKLF